MTSSVAETLCKITVENSTTFSPTIDEKCKNLQDENVNNELMLNGRHILTTPIHFPCSEDGDYACCVIFTLAYRSSPKTPVCTITMMMARSEWRTGQAQTTTSGDLWGDKWQVSERYMCCGQHTRPCPTLLGISALAIGVLVCMTSYAVVAAAICSGL